MISHSQLQESIAHQVDSGMQLGVFVIEKLGDDFKFNYINKNFSELIGVGQEMIHGNTVYDYLSTEEADFLNHHFSEVLQQKKPLNFYEKYKWPAGRICWSMYLDVLPGTQAIFGQVLNQTDYERVRQGMTESERQKSKLFSILPDVILSINKDGIIGDIEQNIHSKPSLRPLDYIGRSYHSFVAEQDQELFDDWINKARLAQTPLPFVFKGSIDQNYYDFEGRVITASDQEVTFFIRDITESVAAQKAIENAKKAAENSNNTKTFFLANLSHELCTPLNAILGFSDMIRQESLGPIQPNAYQQYAQDIYESGQHLLSLINSMLDMTKIEAGVMTIRKTQVDTEQVIRETVTMLRANIDAAQYQVKCDFKDTARHVHADERVLRQMLLNLLSNALKFTPPNGIITISTMQTPQKETCITVEDTGIGIAPEHIETVLRPFGQIENSLSKQHTGSGLGLPLVHSYMKLHGGQLKLSSQVGSGTKAELIFPVASAIKVQQRA